MLNEFVPHLVDVRHEATDAVTLRERHELAHEIAVHVEVRLAHELADQRARLVAARVDAGLDEVLDVLAHRAEPERVERARLEVRERAAEVVS